MSDFGSSVVRNRKQSSLVSWTASTNTGLDVFFGVEETATHFSWFWLRDHGIDENSLDPETLQRRIDTFSLPSDAKPTGVRFDASQQLVHIDWVDGSTTTVSGYLLASVAGRAPEAHELTPTRPRVLWDKHAPLKQLPTVSYDAVMESNTGLREWLENIVVYGFSLVEDVPATEEGSQAIAERIGMVQETIFGRMWMLSAQITDHGDSAYSTHFLEPHTDSSYYHDAPGLQMFNCIDFDGKGGESVQVDGFAIAERLRARELEAYQTLTEIVVPGQYLEPGVHLWAERPPFRLNSRGELVQVTFNNYDRAPFLLSDEDSKRFYHAYALFHEHAIDQENWLKIPLRPGMMLIFDNWRNLHGRMGYVGKRVFCGCYINRAAMESRLRVLQTQSSIDD